MMVAHPASVTTISVVEGYVRADSPDAQLLAARRPVAVDARRRKEGVAGNLGQLVLPVETEGLAQVDLGAGAPEEEEPHPGGHSYQQRGHAQPQNPEPMVGHPGECRHSILRRRRSRVPSPPPTLALLGRRLPSGQPWAGAPGSAGALARLGSLLGWETLRQLVLHLADRRYVVSESGWPMLVGRRDRPKPLTPKVGRRPSAGVGVFE